MMLARLIIVELRKLGGSLALLLAVVSPALVGLLCFMAAVAGERAPSWAEILGMITFQVWAFFLLPMTLTAFTALIGQIEYKPKAWDHLLALPIRRWHLYLAKTVVVYAAVAAMTVLAFVFAWLGATVGGLMVDRPPTGDIPWARVAVGWSKMIPAAAAMIVLQLWVSLRFAYFVIPLAFGITATLVSFAVLITQTQKADWFPWLLPINAVRHAEPSSYVLAGVVGGALALLLMLIDLSRREMR